MEYVSMDTSPKLPPEHFLTCSPVESGEVSDYAYPIHLSSDFIDKNQEDLLGGTLFVEIADAKIIDGSVVHNEDSLIIPTSAPESFQLRRRRLAAIDTRSVLVLRINARDTSPYFTASEIYDFVFNETEPTLRSQYGKLSFGKLNFVPTDYGVMDIDVNLNAKGSSTAVIRDAAIAVVAAQARVSSIKALADHVMFCLPPGTGSWAGSSPVNSWRIVLNNKWCGYLSGMMHEMGHNLGLLHSNEGGVVYKDFTSYMSAGFSSSFYPSKSFNGANNWQLGWYSDRELEFDPEQGGQKIILATFVDYGKTNKSNPVLIKVGNVTYLQYNRAKDFNYQTQEMIDEVTIVQQLSNGTSLLGGVNASNSQLAISNFDGSGRDLLVYVCSSGSGNADDPDWVSLGIGFDHDFCNQTAFFSTVEPTSATSIPSAAPLTTPLPSAASPATCEDDAVATFLISSIPRNCAWLSIRPSLFGRVCIPGNPAYEYCPKVCSACVNNGTKPSIFSNSNEPPVSNSTGSFAAFNSTESLTSFNYTQSLAPSNFTESSSSFAETLASVNSNGTSMFLLPTAGPTASPSGPNCYDSPTAQFLVNSTFGRKTCVWLAARPDWQVQLCAHEDARGACPRTCGVCTSNCIDQSGTFQESTSGAYRNCLWLSLRFKLWQSYCLTPEVSSLCPVTCHTCS